MNGKSKSTTIRLINKLVVLLTAFIMILGLTVLSGCELSANNNTQEPALVVNDDNYIEYLKFRETLSEANKFDEYDYTRESWAEFSSALNQANYVTRTWHKTEDALKAAVVLNTAIENLVAYKYDIDMSILNQTIILAKLFNEEDYIPDTFSKLQEAISKAEYFNFDVTQAEIDDAAANIISALANLINK